MTRGLFLQNCSPVPSDVDEEDVKQTRVGTKKHSYGKTWRNQKGEFLHNWPSINSIFQFHSKTDFTNWYEDLADCPAMSFVFVC